MKMRIIIGFIIGCVFFTSLLAFAQEDDAQETGGATIEEITSRYLNDLSCEKVPVSIGGKICRDATLFAQYHIAVEYYYEGLSDNTIKIKKVRKLDNAQDVEKNEEILEFPVTEERRFIIELADGRKLLLNLDKQNQLKVKVYQ